MEDDNYLRIISEELISSESLMAANDSAGAHDDMYVAVIDDTNDHTYTFVIDDSDDHEYTFIIADSDLTDSVSTQCKAMPLELLVHLECLR